ncbi:hypothetical protein [Luteolibacter sp. Populi]|uniref:hypothetical protein n=1 Tax=Luteolibacter sp. Populi TaxID=3230487 RepID=UPI003467B157
MTNALTLMGVGDRERNDVMAVMSKATAEMLKAEKLHVKVARADESGILLDQSGMEDPSKHISEEAKAGLRSSLAPEIAEALIGSINWENFYFRSPTKEILFLITRNANGLAATTEVGGSGAGRGLGAGDYPDNGVPIPASEVFEPRWAELLGERKLLPVDR